MTNNEKITEKTYHKFAQNSQEWHAHRAWPTFNASDIAKVMGVDKYTTRDEFIAQCATGETPEISTYLKRIFDKGHKDERLARPIAEKIVGEELFPATISIVVDGLKFSASFDGLTIDQSISWEHKGLNCDLSTNVQQGTICDMHKIQMEVQLFISGAEKCLFMASENGNEETMVSTWYESTPGLMDEIIAACKQFKADVDAYVPVVADVDAMPAPVESLPAIRYQLNGMAIKSNLDEYREAAERLVEESKLPMTTDQEFATAEVRNKALRKAVKDIKAVCDRVINEVSDIAKFRDDLMSIGEMLRQAALNGEKQVKARKEQLRFDIIKKAERDLADYCSKLDAELDGGPYLGRISGNFINAAKGKSKLSSVQSAVNDELARAKIEADGIARKIRVNLKTLSEEAEEFKFLFADYKQIIFKETEDFGALVRDRVAQHKADVTRKAAEKKAAEEQAEAKRKAAEERDRAAKEYMELTVAEGEAAGRQKVALKNCNENNVSIEKDPTIQIMKSIAAHGISSVIANTVAQLIVDGKIDRVYFS